MFNFSANHMFAVSSTDHDKAKVSILIYADTKRCYKVYDYKKAFKFEPNKMYCISGKVNSADKLYSLSKIHI